MICLNVVVNVIHDELGVAFTNITNHPQVSFSAICGFDFAWDNVLDADGFILCDYYGRELLIKTANNE